MIVYIALPYYDNAADNPVYGLDTCNEGGKTFEDGVEKDRELDPCPLYEDLDKFGKCCIIIYYTIRAIVFLVSYIYFYYK